jgi:hypothetical protein
MAINHTQSPHPQKKTVLKRRQGASFPPGSRRFAAKTRLVAREEEVTN